MIKKSIIDSWHTSTAGTCDSLLNHYDNITIEQYNRIKKVHLLLLEIQREVVTGIPCPEGSLS